MISNPLKNIGILVNIFPSHRIKADLYQKPEDFIVEEIFPKYRCTIERKIEKIPNFSGKRYIEATLVKKNISTFDACKIIAKENNLHFNDISYCGLKDTFGITAQRVCILNRGKLKHIKFKNVFLKDFRGTNKKLNLREHIGNHFIVKARNISVSSEKCGKLLQIFKERIERGLPNFYYFQRFGKRQQNHILGKLILKKKCEEFISRFLTETSKNEPREITLIRKKIKANFNNLFICLKFLQKYPS